MFQALYEQFLVSFPLMVAYYDAGGFETMALLNSTVPRANGLFNRDNKE